MKENFTSIPSRSRLELCHLALETHDLELLGLHLAVARESMLRVLGQLLHPIAQLRRVNVQVLRRLHIGHASILDQAHGLKLELSRKLPSLHDPPPAPSKHLTRCLRNRVQARNKIIVAPSTPVAKEADIKHWRSRPSARSPLEVAPAAAVELEVEPRRLLVIGLARCASPRGSLIDPPIRGLSSAAW